MSFATYVDTVPSVIRVLVGILVTVGITLAFAVPLRRRAVAWDQLGRDDDDSLAPERRTPVPEQLGGKVLGFATTAFIFLLAFTLGHMWGNGEQARSAALSEDAAYVKALSTAGALPGATRDEVVALVQAYRESVITREWPLLKQGDGVGAFDVHTQASVALASGVNQALADVGSNAAVSPLESAIDDMLTDATDRITEVPARDMPALIIAIFLLGITMLVLTAMLFPTRSRAYIALLALLGVLTAVLWFNVLEASNPFVGDGAVPIPILANP